jgi:hypothetical protein
MLFMVIERFKGRDPAPIYQRLRESGRHIPDGLKYIDSWIEANFDRCFQLMETDDPRLLQQWVNHWRDLMDFEFVPVVSSKDTRAILEGNK